MPKVETIQMWTDRLEHRRYTYYKHRQSLEQMQVEVLCITDDDGAVTYAIPVKASHRPQNDTRMEAERKEREAKQQKQKEDEEHLERMAVKAGTDTIYCRETVGCDCARCQGYWY